MRNISVRSYKCNRNAGAAWIPTIPYCSQLALATYSNRNVVSDIAYNISTVVRTVVIC